MAQRTRGSVARRKTRGVSRRRRRRHGHPVARAAGRLIYFSVWRVPSWAVVHAAHGVRYLGREMARTGKGVGHTAAGKIHVPEDYIKCECGEAVKASRHSAHWVACASRDTWNKSSTGPVKATAERTDRPGPQAIRNREALPPGDATCPGCHTEFPSRGAYRHHLMTTRSWKCLHSAARIEYRRARGWAPSGPSLPPAPTPEALPAAGSNSSKTPTTKGSAVNDPTTWASSSDVLTDPALDTNEDVIEWFTARTMGAHTLVENIEHEGNYLTSISMEPGIMAIHEEIVQAAKDMEDAHDRMRRRADELWSGVPTLEFGKGK